MIRNIYILTVLLFLSMSVGWGQDCIDGVEVEIFGWCYNIEETITLDPSCSSVNGQIIPPEIGLLTNLQNLEIISGCGLIGEIPPEIGNLSNLTQIKIPNSNLSGGIPSEIYNLTNLTRIDLNNCGLTGQISSDIGNLSQLDELNLNDNELSGEIPSEIGYLSELRELRLYDNNFEGEIPSEIGNLFNLNHLNLMYNQLSGLIPEEICQILPMSFEISNNQFCPPYPWCFEFFGIGIGEQDTSECIECPLYLGDINSDLTLDILDIVLVVNCILSESCNWCSDFNEDGITNVLDIMSMVDVIMDY